VKVVGVKHYQFPGSVDRTLDNPVGHKGKGKGGQQQYGRDVTNNTFIHRLPPGITDVKFNVSGSENEPLICEK
jgi:hypothetical protein